MAKPRRFTRRDAVVLLVPLALAALALLAPDGVVMLWLLTATLGLMVNFVAFVDALADVRLTRVLVATLPPNQHEAAEANLHAGLRRDLSRIAVQAVFVFLGLAAMLWPRVLALVVAPALVYAEAVIAAGGWADRSVRKEVLAVLEEG